MLARSTRRVRCAPVAALGAALLWPAAAGAQAALPPGSARALGMNEAVRIAAASHPSVRNAAGQALVADEFIDAARSAYYPQVNAGISSSSGNVPIDGYSGRQAHQASLWVSQMLYDFGKVKGAVDEAQGAAVAARARVLLAIDNVTRDTAQAWVEVHRQQAMGNVAQAQVDGVRALAALVSERQSKGATSQSDVAQAQSRLEAARTQLLSAEAQAQRWRLNLMNLTQGTMPAGIAGEAPATLEGACGARAGALVGLLPPSVQLAQADLDTARAALRSADAQLLPTLSLEGSVNRGLNAGSRLPGQQSNVSSLMVNLSAPLYEGGRSQARQRAAVRVVEAAEAALAHAQLSARQQLADAQAQSQDHAQRMPVLNDRAASTRLTRDLYREQYLQLGSRSLLDLLNAEQEFHAARFDRVQSAHELQRLAMECLYQSGRLRDAFGLTDVAGAFEGGPP
ncbi:TolC family outer membrane protein [Variovorax sp. M-6]|uniref:TolC family outer membrane protein n=1 Tax=Variovorax sp. M-6 TaxID=3233041 RepID=UPI003F943339